MSELDPSHSAEPAATDHVYSDALHHARRVSLGRSIIAVGMTLIMTAGMFVATHETHDSEPSMDNSAQPAPGRDESKEPTACVEPTESDIRDVQRLFNEPNNSLIEKSVPEYKGDRPVLDPIAFRTEEAKKFGLTLVDVRPYDPRITLDKKRADKGTSGYWYNGVDISEYSFSKLFDASQEYLDKFGVSISAETEARGEPYNTEPLTESDLDLMTSKIAVLEIMYALADIPVEVVKKAGVKKIGLVRSLGSLKNTPFSGMALEDGTILISLGNQSSSFTRSFTEQADWSAFVRNVFRHELTHELDRAAWCGRDARWKDESFRSLNPVPGLYIDEKPVLDSNGTPLILPVTAEDHHGFLDAETYDRTKIMGVSTSTDIANEAVITTPIPGGFGNPVEDKAGFGNIILVPDEAAQTIINGNSRPIIQDKTRFLLGRMRHIMPSYVEYLADVSDHTDIKMLIAQQGGKGAG